MALGTLRINASSDIPEKKPHFTGLTRRLEDALRDATRESTDIIYNQTVRNVVARTTMSQEIAQRITRQEYNGNPPTGAVATGQVMFTDPRPGWDIYPKTAKVLAFHWPGHAVGVQVRPDGMAFFAHVHHPGARPVKLLEEAGYSSERAVFQTYDEKVRAAVEGL